MEPVLLVRSGPDVPWGFRLQGGTDQQKPLAVQRVTPGSVAARGLIVGDEILRIGNTDAVSMTYSAAMEAIKGSGDRLELYTARTGVPRQSREPSNIASTPYTTNDIGPGPAAYDLNPDPSPPRQREVYPEYDRRDPGAAAVPRQHEAPATQVPDAVLNMAARTTQDKRPWTYAPDMQSLQQQRRRVQRRDYTPTRVHASVPIHTQPSRSPQVQRSQPPHQTAPRTQDTELEPNGEGDIYRPIYEGPEIPSRTLQMLQSYTSSCSESGNTDLARAVQRRRVRREKLHHDGDNSSVGGQSQVRAAEPEEFDEAAYLAGEIPLLGQNSGQVSRPIRQNWNNARDQDEEEERNDDKPFDERAYLAGRIPLVKGGPIDPRLFDLPLQSGSSVRPGGEDLDERDDESKKPFDERAYLAGRIPLVKGGPIDPTQFNVPDRPAVRRYRETNRPRRKQPFDERAYLAGKLNILGGDTTDGSRIAPPHLSLRSAVNAETKPTWCKKEEDMVSEDEYDEESFLRGKFPIVRRSVDREIQPRRVPERSRYDRERASWERKNLEEDDGRGGICSETEFDECAYLGGKWGRRLTTDKEYSTDTEAEIPSKTLRILRRSVSSERSADGCTGWNSSNEGGLSGDETGSGEEKPLNYLMYQGRHIPSKSFSRLKKTMDRKAAADKSRKALDPIERLKEKSLENLGIDVDTALERLEIGKHDPDTYMEMLKKSVEENQNGFRIEQEDEVTDF